MDIGMIVVLWLIALIMMMGTFPIVVAKIVIKYEEKIIEMLEVDSSEIDSMKMFYDVYQSQDAFVRLRLVLVMGAYGIAFLMFGDKSVLRK